MNYLDAYLLIIHSVSIYDQFVYFFSYIQDIIENINLRINNNLVLHMWRTSHKLKKN